MLDRFAGELEYLHDLKLVVELPKDLDQAYLEREALAETLRAVESPEETARLREVYREALADAEPYGDEMTAALLPGDIESSVSLKQSIDALLEEARRERLLAAA